MSITTTTTTSFLLLQLADGTFPSGGFAHSSGLEAMMVLGGLARVDAFLDASLDQLGHAALPFVRAVAADPGRLAELDDAYDATLTMRSPNRASRTQGRALASAASRVWSLPLVAIGEHARMGRPSHHAPIFGAIFGTLGIRVDDAVMAYLHGAARNVLSAAVRLGLIGPLEAQCLLAERAPVLEAICARTQRKPEDAAQTAPLLEIYAALHDRLDGRMFQS